MHSEGSNTRGGESHYSHPSPPQSENESDGTDSDAKPTEAQPKDLMTAAVAVSKFHVSRGTLQRMLRQGKIKSYRPKNAASNATHLYSQKELARYFTPVD